MDTITGLLLAIALSVTIGATSGHPGERAPAVNLGVNEQGRWSIVASTFGRGATAVDLSDLSLVARRLDANDSAERVLSFTPGKILVSRLPGDVQNASETIVVGRPPDGPGIYAVHARESADHPTFVSWADEQNGDHSLARARARLVGRLLYGFGGIAISCPPDWTNFYSAYTPLRVRSIDRERGKVTWLATGAAASTPYVGGAGFIAVDPLRLEFERPADDTKTLGTNARIPGMRGPCPEIELADWQIDATLSLRPPPRTERDLTAASPLRVGLTRDEVIWSRGYPNEVGTRSMLRAETTWHYAHTTMDAYEVAFRNDRVASLRGRGYRSEEKRL